MSKSVTPETELISQLTSIRETLTAERETLLARIATIDTALALGTPAPPKATTKPAKAARKTPRVGGIREAVTAAVKANPGQTIKSIQEALPEHSPSSVEATVRAMASAGQLSKDESHPRRFSLPAAVPAPNGKANGTPKANGVSAPA